MKDKELQELLKSKLEGHQSTVPPELWGNIATGISSTSGAAGSSGFLASVSAKIVAAVVAVTAIVAVTVWVDNDDSSPENKPEQVTASEKSELNQEKVLKTDEPLELTDVNEVTESVKSPTRNSSNEEDIDSVGENQVVSSESNDDKSSVHNDENYSPADEPVHSKAEQREDNQKVESMEPAENESEETTQKLSGDSFTEVDVIINQKENDPLTIDYRASGSGRYMMRFGDGNESYLDSGTYTYSSEGDYTISVRAIDESIAHDATVEVHTEEIRAWKKAVISLPNVFTPFSSAGQNDLYGIQKDLSSGIKSYTLYIYTMEGELLFESTNDIEKWDGLDRYGNEMPVGMYLAIVEAYNAIGQMTKETQSVYLKR